MPEPGSKTVAHGHEVQIASAVRSPEVGRGDRRPACACRGRRNFRAARRWQVYQGRRPKGTASALAGHSIPLKSREPGTVGAAGAPSD